MKKVFKVVLSIFCFVLGAAVGALGCLIQTTPESYEIPNKISSNGTVVAGDIKVQTVKQQDLSIHFLELGNKYTGDCTFIKIGDVEMLVDAGSKTSSIKTIKEYIGAYIEGELDYVIVTHAHEDHYAGFATKEVGADSLFDYFDVGHIIDFGTGTNKTEVDDGKTNMFENYIRERRIEIEVDGAKYTPVQDFFKAENPVPRTFELGTTGAYVEILYHKFYDQMRAETENDYSVCFQLVYDDKYYLFTGDLEAEGEESLVHEHIDGKNKDMLHEVELYKAGHHGSKTSSTEALMNIVKPKVVCVCCCAGSSEYTSKNENQFPTQEFINNVYKANPEAKIYVTTLCIDYKANSFTSFNGNIVFCANVGEERTVFFSNNETELRNTDWFKKNRTLPASA